MTNILDAEDDRTAITNAEAVAKNINAAPYVILDNGATLCADEGATANYSLKGLVETVDSKIGYQGDDAYAAVETFKTAWIDGITWNNAVEWALTKYSEFSAAVAE